MPRRPSKSQPDDVVVLTDPKAVRALAHPARLVVIDALYNGEVLTATECADRADVSPSSMSYHLRALEKFGIVQRASDRVDGRQRPWERAGRWLRIDVGAAPDSVAGLAATSFLIEESMRTDRERLIREGERAAATGDSSWFDAANYSRGRFLVTPEESRALVERIEKVTAPYLAESRKRRPKDARLVMLSVLVVRESVDDEPAS